MSNAAEDRHLPRTQRRRDSGGGAARSELLRLPVIPHMARDDDPRAPYKVYEGAELKGHTQHALKRGAHNSGSPRPNRGNSVIMDNLERVVI